MSTTLAPPRIKPEDLLRMPDEGRGYELINGELRELNVSTESSRVGVLFVSSLLLHIDRAGLGWVFGNDMGFQCFADDADKICRADAAFVSFERLPVETYQDTGYCHAVPELVVEVVSLHDTAREVEEKTQEWLDAGTRVVWVAYPLRRIIYAHRSAGPVQVYREEDTLSADDVLPEFSVPVAGLFKLPGKQS